MMWSRGDMGLSRTGDGLGCVGKYSECRRKGLKEKTGVIGSGWLGLLSMQARTSTRFSGLHVGLDAKPLR